MAIPPRRSAAVKIASTARTFFVTSSTWDKRNLLQSQRSATLFIDILYQYRAQGRFRLHEFVVMPDHFHLLLTVGSDISIERAVQLIKGRFAYEAGKEFGIKAPLWQKGFSEVPVLESHHYTKIVEYIRFNPVRRHLVTLPEEYPYSSARTEFQLDPATQGLKPVELVASNDRAEALS